MALFWALTRRKTLKLFMWLLLGTVSKSAFHVYCNDYYYTVKKRERVTDNSKCKININLRKANNPMY